MSIEIINQICSFSTSHPLQKVGWVVGYGAFTSRFEIYAIARHLETEKKHAHSYFIRVVRTCFLKSYLVVTLKVSDEFGGKLLQISWWALYLTTKLLKFHHRLY